MLGLFIGWAVTGDPRAAHPVARASRSPSALVASLFSYYAGDSLVLRVSGAKEVDAQAAPQLLNVVQEMAIAANVPMPKVYLIDDTAPNAFATGRDPQHASVAITTGLLQKLDREELQGVMAHELVHVRNFDIRFSLMVGVLVGSIALLADFFLRFTFWGGGGRSPDATTTAAVAGSRSSCSWSRSCWRSSRRSWPGSSSWRSAASASTWPTRRASS